MLSSDDTLLCLFTPAVPGVQRRQVCKEDPDRGGLRVAGQSRPAQARSELAQAARQHHSDPLVEGAPPLKVFLARGDASVHHA